MAKFNGFVPQNIAYKSSEKIGVYNSKGKCVGKISLGGLVFPQLGEKLYSFGALSDVHYQYSTAADDFKRALTFLNQEENVKFTCICGDLTASGTEEELAEYKACVEAYSPNTPVYAISGNHEPRNADFLSILETYTGHPLYYSFTYGNDVFIMVGIKADSVGKLFTTDELQWLYETLEANRNKRCFVFQHVRPDDACGNAFGVYGYDIWGGTEQIVFESLLRHYKNIVLFHGHSHLKFDMQLLFGKGANYDTAFGVHSVHIPSLAVPSTGDATGTSSYKYLYSCSEGYVIDVYKNHIVLKGRDFAEERFLPIANYCLDTTLKVVEANTFVDSTGTITI